MEGKNKKQKMKSERGNGGLNHAGSLYRLQLYWVQMGVLSKGGTLSGRISSHVISFRFLATPCHLRDLSSLTRDWTQALTLFKYRILTPGLPGNVLIRYILKGLFWVLFWEKPGREHALKQGSQEVMAIIQMRDGSDLDSGGTNGKGVKKRSGSWNILKAECKFSALNNWNDRKNAGRF